MEALLSHLVSGQVYAFMLVFMRIGTAFMIMPGVGDSFIPARVRLFFALAFCVIVTPMLGPLLPEFAVGGMPFFVLAAGEFIIGAFIGTIARIFMSATDTAGMFMSTQMSLANAQIFNPSFATQGSIMGSFLSITGLLLLFATNLHHVLFQAVIGSYQSFVPGQVGIGISSDMADAVAWAVAQAFTIGFHMAVPFIIVTMMLYVAMGILSRLMPQWQVFLISIPVQISLGLLTFILVSTTVFMYWLDNYEAAIERYILPTAGMG